MGREVSSSESAPITNDQVIIHRVEQLKKFSRELQSMVYEELALVQEDVIRVRNIVSDSIHILQTSVQAIGDEAQKTVILAKKLHSAGLLEEEQESHKDILDNKEGDELKKFMGENDDIDSVLEKTQELLNTNNSSIMRALQFEDIVSQVADRVAQQIGDIRTTVNTLSHLYDSEFSPTFDQDLIDMREELSEIRKKLAASATKKFAGQKNMNEGDIDLF